MTTNVKEMKIVFWVDVAVGKTALVNRWVHNEYHDTVPTAGAMFTTKRIADVKYQCWDISGQEKYHSLLPNYLKGVNIGVLVFDVNNRASYERLSAQIAVVKKYSLETMKFILVGNKCDKEKENRQVTTEEAEAFAAKNQMTYCEVSPLMSVGMGTFDQQIVSLSQPMVQENQKNAGAIAQVSLLQKINDFAQLRPNNHQVQHIARILREGLNTSDPEAYYEQHQDELVTNYRALRWTSKSLLNSALNAILTVFAKFGLHFSDALARNQSVRGHQYMFYAFGAHQEAQVLAHEIAEDLLNARIKREM